MYLFLILFIVVGVLVYVKIEKKIKIKWKTLLKKHIKAKSDRYGVYCFHAKQGQGKTYNAVKFLYENQNKMPITSNVHLKGIRYTYCNNYDKILEIGEKGGQLILFDEIFSKFNKNSKPDQATVNFLSQMRKRGNILLTTAQEWLEMPLWLRRKVKIDIKCSRRNFGPFTVIKEVYGDTDNMKWSELDNDYVSPIIETSISLMTKKIANCYDTNETISLAS